ncbi:MAG: EAL domain-containing protein [Vicinamibacteria bacterium]|jgi:EAL domain-containing protein (putative c-di-GMP-specific phosphodiesterase class I)|nr:EAL domain-containing protein [Vicinamibacteria bacterium]
MDLVSACQTLVATIEHYSALLRERGGLGTILIDLTPLARIELGFGSEAYRALRGQIVSLIIEARGRGAEDEPVILDERSGDRLLLFITPDRKDEAFSFEHLRRVADRVEGLLRVRVARLAAPYQREKPTVEVGYGFVIHNPLADSSRQIQGLIADARRCAELRHRARERERREGLNEIIFNRRIWTAFQAINSIESRQAIGHEALSRGPRGTDLESPMALFGLAARQGLTEELERACRQQTFADWQVFGGAGRLFVNTVPSTIRDPTFLGRGVIDILGPDLSPRFVTLEITERQVIENITLYREAMHTFIELGFSFAIDDLGAGYSSLETVANLGASYLKIDMSLVRDVHQRRVSQQIVKAIVEVGVGVNAIVIAEGIETEDEALALRDLGIRYGQGYLYGRPINVIDQKTSPPR